MTYPTPISLNKVKLIRGLLAERAKTVHEEVIPYQWEALNDRIAGAEPSYAIANLKIAAGEQSGEFRGMVFQDSDLAKWLEAVAYRLASAPDPELESTADQVIDLFAKAQHADGYLNTYYQITDLNKRWTNLRENHELYCAGHLIEAAVAYFLSTGKRKFLDVVCRLADHIDSMFGPQEGKRRGYPGHPEIELALMKLYRVTQEERYLDLALYFVEERGKQPHYFELEAKERGDDLARHWGKWGHKYSQAHKSIYEQDKAVGHSVRAMYLYCAVADLALETNNKQLWDVCERLWQNTVNQQMYITGGIGSQSYGEAFTIDYDLPNDTSYTETCASIGLVFWAQRMLSYKPQGTYGDVMEKALYNGVLSGMSLDGKKFFYVNPLEVWPDVCQERHDLEHVKSTRQDWFACACCPPNIARLLTSLGQYIYTESEGKLFVHLYAGSEVAWQINDTEVQLTQQTDYPFDEYVRIIVNPATQVDFTLALRIPGWCRNPEVTVNGEPVDRDQVSGYLYLDRTWSKGDIVDLIFPMPIEIMRANPLVRENAGKVALQRGPLVYCLEETDNGANLPALSLVSKQELTISEDSQLGLPVILGKAVREKLDGNQLYSPEDLSTEEVTLKAIPYYAWANRKSGEMQVWIREARR